MVITYYLAQVTLHDVRLNSDTLTNPKGAVCMRVSPLMPLTQFTFAHAEIPMSHQSTTTELFLLSADVGQNFGRTRETGISKLQKELALSNRSSKYQGPHRG